MSEKDMIHKLLDSLQGSGLNIHVHSNSLTQYYEVEAPFSIHLAINDPSKAENSYQFMAYAPDQESYQSYPRSIVAKGGYMHHVNYSKLMYVYEGSLYHLIEERRILYTAGSCCLINQNIRHAESFDTPYTVIFFNIKPDFLERLRNYGRPYMFRDEVIRGNNLTLQYLYENAKSEEKTFLDYQPIFQKQESQERMRELFDQMVQTLLTHEFGSTFRILELFCRMINILSDPLYYHVSRGQLLSGSDSIIFNRVRNLLEDSRGCITRAQIVQTLNYSASHISHIVKKHTGMSLSDLSMSIRLNAAAAMLLTTEQSVTEIMETLHFSNRTHFYQLFEKKYGCTPKQYRNSL